METYNIYRNLKYEIKNKKLKLSDLKGQAGKNNTEVEKLEASIEEDINGLNMVFDYIISQKGK